MYHWKYHDPTNQEIKEKDFRKTNKDCVGNNLHTASQFYDFRKTSTSMSKPKTGSKNIPIYLPHDGFTYGRPLEYPFMRNSLEDPIRVLLGNGYG